MIWVQTESGTLNYPVLTVGRVQIKYPSVPPGEAAHCILAAQKAARRLRT
jgi:hypothetical protein